MCIAAGEANSTPLPFRAADLVRLELNLLGVRGARRHDAMVVLDLLARGLIHAPVAARFALAQAREAHLALESRTHETATETAEETGAPRLGRIVLEPTR